MFGELPYELVLDILRGLSAKDLVNVRRTCKELYLITEDPSLWSYVLSEILGYPLPYTVRIDPCLWPEPLRKRVLIASRVDDAWHDRNIMPRHVQFIPSASGLKDVVLLPGGQWLVSLLQDGTLELQSVHGIAPMFRLATHMNPAEMTCQGSSVHISPVQDIYVIYSFTTRVTIYRVNVNDSAIPIELVDEVQSTALPGLPYTGRVFAGGNLIAMLCSDARGRTQLHIRSISASRDDTILQTQMTVVLDSEDSIVRTYFISR
ncbi:hypothetical protein NEOLEDRAFT_305626 [Neolentinus lepideus HHB14362 ss-1]|uniref:F-box domain-containing protein n=1 Tax=Neolentinus lepideus HHB14362 ss-1 TaxID=1314782 RepID=A0A165VRG7_9AGAM|nr:hypothetical protein NEOLEDRAFT_305626 [Neolentinus lepideus HHB14362 ss-1]